jgi:hypothetical protein
MLVHGNSSLIQTINFQDRDYRSTFVREDHRTIQRSRLLAMPHAAREKERDLRLLALGEVKNIPFDSN